MRLTVVVPAHDAAASIGAALRSALAQTRPPEEIVVVDDGSTDDTAAAVNAAAPGARLIRQGQQGPAAARNTGLAAATGDWVAFLDADDEWHPEKLARQTAVVLDRPDVVLVASDWARVAVTGTPPAVVPTSTVTEEQIELLNRFQTSTVVARRDVVSALGGFDAGLDGVEDWDLWLRLAGAGAVVKLDWPFVRYTDTAGGYSKGLERVYRTGRMMLERRFGPDPGRHGRRVLAWHHLRFAVAFALDGDRAAARACLADGRHAGLSGAAPGATVRYLVPFLAGRARRRLRT